MKKTLLTILRFLLFLSIGLGILYYAYYNQNIAYQQQCEMDGISAEQCSLADKLITDFKGVNYFWVLLSVMIFTVSNVSRAIQWDMLIKPLGRETRTRNTFMAILVGYMANSVIPRAGEIARCGILSRYEKVGAHKLLGTVAVSRTLDVIFLLIFIGLMLLLQFDVVWDYLQRSAFSGGDDGSGSPLMFILLGLMVAGGIAALVFRKQLLKIPLVQKVWNIILGFWEGIVAIGKLEKPGWFVFHTVLIWVCYYSMTYVLFFSFEPTSHLSPVVGLTVFVFGSLGIVIPSPGGIGAYQFLVSTALATFYAIDPGDAFSFSNIAFFPIFFTNIILGLISLGLFPILNKTEAGNEPEEVDQVDSVAG